MLKRGDNDPQRHCSIPNILGIREWYESRYGNICKTHDLIYLFAGDDWSALPKRWRSDKDYIHTLIETYKDRPLWKRTLNRVFAWTHMTLFAMNNAVFALKLIGRKLREK